MQIVAQAFLPVSIVERFFHSFLSPHCVYVGGVSALEGRNGGFLLQDVAQFVDAFQQAVFGEWVYWKLYSPAIRQYQSLRRKIDSHRDVGIREQLSVNIARNYDR